MSFIDSIKNSHGQDDIKTIIKQLQNEGIYSDYEDTGKVELESLIDFCRDETKRITSELANNVVPENSIFLHNGFIALQLFSMYMVANSYLKENVKTIFNDVIKPFFGDFDYSLQSHVDFRVEALSLYIRLVQNFQDVMNQTSNEALDFICRVLSKYSELIKKGDNQLNLVLHYAFIGQISTLISLLSQLDRNSLSSKANGLFVDSCKIFLNVENTNWKYELLGIIGYLLNLSNSLKCDEDELEDESDDSFSDNSENENIEVSVFLIPQSNKKKENTDKEYYWKLSDTQIDDLVALIETASELIETAATNFNREPSIIPTFLGTVCEASSIHFDTETHGKIFGKSLETILNHIKNSPIEYSLIHYFSNLGYIFRFAKPVVIRSYFMDVYETLEDVILSLREWIKENPSKKHRKQYFLLREQLMKAFTSLILSDSLSTWQKRDHFINISTKLFSDPLLLSSFIKSIYGNEDIDSHREYIVSEILPSFMQQFQNEFKRNTSTQIKILMIKSVGEIAYATGKDFKPYLIEFVEIFLNLLERNPFKFCVPVLDSLAMFMSGVEDISILDDQFENMIKTVLNIINGEYEDMDVEDDEILGYDNYGYFIYLSLVFIKYLFGLDHIREHLKNSKILFDHIEPELQRLIKSDLLYFEEEDIRNVAEELLSSIKG